MYRPSQTPRLTLSSERIARALAGGRPANRDDDDEGPLSADIADLRGPRDARARGADRLLTRTLVRFDARNEGLATPTPLH
jgi:hypothetical protein